MYAYIEKRKKEIMAKRKRAIKRYTSMEKDIYDYMCSQRRYKEINQFPKEVQEKILFSLKKVLYLYPDIEKIWLVGSFAKGDWVDESTYNDMPEFVELRNKVKGKEKLSDIDLLTEPMKIKRIEGSPKIDLCAADTPHKILLYDEL